MKIAIPLAGFGKRLRPHTYSRPKPLLEVAGKAVLGHIMDELAVLDIEEIIFIVSDKGDQIAVYMQDHYPQYPVRFVEQDRMLGQSYGVYTARPYIEAGEVLVIFSDTVFKTDLASLRAVDADGALHFWEVPDPARFGVGVVDQAGYVTRLVEKPTTPVSNLAIVGVYYFKDANRLFGAIEKQLSSGLQLNGEYFLADAITLMLEGGARFKARNLALWEDCGTIPALLEANRNLLRLAAGSAGSGPDNRAAGYTVVPPVYIAPDAKIERSVIGPFASVGSGAYIVDSVVSDSIVHEKSQITASLLTGSVIGRNTTVTGRFERLNIGDDSQLG